MKKVSLSCLLAISLVACGGGDQPPVLFTSVEYVIVGASIGNTVDATYNTPDGSIEQKKVTLPGSIFYFAFDPGKLMYVSAQNPTNAGSITVSIKVNGVTKKTATSTAAYGIATSSGTCCN